MLRHILAVAGLAPSKLRSLFAAGALVALLLVAVASPIGASADQPALKRMKVSVWPEYDEPRVLVIYQGEFAEGASFPRRVSFRLPPGADINQVCALQLTGEHICQMYETSRDADGVTLTYQLPIPTFFLEFYYFPIEGAGERSIPFEFTPLSPIESLRVDVLQPARASNFTLSQQSVSTQTDGLGLQYHLLDYENVAASLPVAIDISYSKADSEPSTAKAIPQGGTAPRGGDGFGATLAVVGVAVLAMVGVVGYSAFSRRQQRPQMASARSSRVIPAGRPKPKAGKGAVSFCAKCGQTIDPSARFCQACGRPIKR